MSDINFDRDIAILTELIDKLKAQALEGNEAAVKVLLAVMEERRKMEEERDYQNAKKRGDFDE